MCRLGPENERFVDEEKQVSQTKMNCTTKFSAKTRQHGWSASHRNAVCGDNKAKMLSSNSRVGLANLTSNVE